MNLMRFVFLILILLAGQSCVAIHNQFLKNSVDCEKSSSELNARQDLFGKLARKEIARRKKIDLTTYSALNHPSVFSKIVEAVKNAEKNARFIPVDLRYYEHVSLGNIKITNLSQSWLDAFLKTSKYSQTFFALINFNSEKITIAPPIFDKDFERQEILRDDLAASEIVLDVSHAKRLSGNMKFSSGQKVSIIANQIKTPYRLDLREASNMQFNLDRKWIMSVYSINGSSLSGGKDTTGFFRFVNNKNAQIKLDKFNRSTVACYIDANGAKFNP